MFLAHMKVGQIATNCYLFGDKEAGVCAVVDPGDNAPALINMIEQSGMDLQYILVTHGHFDHVLAVPELCEKFPNAVVYVSPEEVDTTNQPINYMKLSVQKNMQYANEGDTLTLGSLTIDVMKTPGHAKGCLVFRVGEHLFTGDTLFQGACGRTDFDGGSYKEILVSLKRLSELEGDYKVYPGHEGFTTLAKERASNQYMNEAMKTL